MCSLNTCPSVSLTTNCPLNEVLDIIVSKYLIINQKMCQSIGILAYATIQRKIKGAIAVSVSRDLIVIICWLRIEKDALVR